MYAMLFMGWFSREKILIIDRMCSFAVKTRTSFRTCFIIISDIFENVDYYFVICFICYGDEALGLKIICHGKLWGGFFDLSVIHVEKSVIHVIFPTKRK